jgi:hypothetical protein
VHNFSIAHTAYGGGGRDVVADFIRSCQKYNVRPGFFYSVHFNWFLGVNNFQVSAASPPKAAVPAAATTHLTPPSPPLPHSHTNHLTLPPHSPSAWLDRWAGRR